MERYPIKWNRIAIRQMLYSLCMKKNMDQAVPLMAVTREEVVFEVPND